MSGALARRVYKAAADSKLQTSATSIMAYLKVSGTKIVDQNGEEVILRGAGLGGWMK